MIGQRDQKSKKNGYFVYGHESNDWLLNGTNFYNYEYLNRE